MNGNELHVREHEEANQSGLKAGLVELPFSLELGRDVLPAGADGEGAIREQEGEPRLHPEAVKPEVLGDGRPRAEHDELHFLVLGDSLLHARPARRLHGLRLHVNNACDSISYFLFPSMAQSMESKVRGSKLSVVH